MICVTTTLDPPFKVRIHLRSERLGGDVIARAWLDGGTIRVEATSGRGVHPPAHIEGRWPDAGGLLFGEPAPVDGAGEVAPEVEHALQGACRRAARLLLRGVPR